MRSRIISAFPGTGKSFFAKKYPGRCCDSDSSQYSWIHTAMGKIRNPSFPWNYIDHIERMIGKKEFIFISSHKEVREALKDRCLFFYLIYPDRSNKEEFIKRYRDRGNNEKFVSLLEDNWDQWIEELESEEVGCKRIRMVWDYLENEISFVEAVERGEIVD